MNKWFSVVGTLVLITCLLCVCLLTAVLLSWSILAGLWLFITVIIALGVAYGAYLLIPRMLNRMGQWLGYKLHGRNRLERLLWHHWQRGARMQGWRRFLRRLQPPPWFLVLGMQGSGQRGLLADSQLTSLAGLYDGSSHERLFTCHWWFCRRAMYLVISGHYTGGKSLYRQAWQRLTRWIGWVCVPTGVVLCVPMNLLQEKDNKARFQAARQVREQLESLQHSLGLRLPVWVVITHSEVLPGFQAWSGQLDDEQRKEMLGGFIGPELDGNSSGALKQTLHAVVQALKISRFRQLNCLRGRPEAENLILPEGITRLQPALCEYLDTLFECDHYQQHSLLRGLFFTASETRDGSAPVGIFSQTLLEEALVQQTHGKVALSSPRIWGKRAVCILLAMLAVLGVARSFDSIHTAVLELKCNTTDSATFCNYKRYRQAEAWRARDNGLFYPVQYILRQRLAQRFLQSFSVDNFQPETFIPAIANDYITEPEQTKRQLIVNLARFINHETAMRNGTSLAQLQQLPPWSANGLMGEPALLQQNEYVAIRMAQYRTGTAQQRLTQWRDTLQTLLEKDNDWSWLLDDGVVTNGRAITMADFWPLDESALRGLPVQVNAIYTRDGELAADTVLDEIGEALARPAFFDARRMAFIKDYRQRRQTAWLMLAQAMPQGENRVRGKSDWQRMMTLIGQNNSPYLTFFQRLARETANIPQQERQGWLREQDRLWQLHRYTQKSNMMQRVSVSNFSLRQRILSKLGLSSQLSIHVDDNALSSYRTWRQLLNQTVQRALLSDKAAEQLVKSALGEDFDNSNGSLRMLLNRFAQWWQKAQSGQVEYYDSLLWHLWQGDNRLVLHYAFYSAAEQLQRQWESQVIWPMNDSGERELLSTQELTARLFDYGNNFIRTIAAYALTIHPERIISQEMAGISFPFNDEFLHFVNNIVRPGAVLPVTADIRRRLQEKRALLSDPPPVSAREPEQEAEQSRWAMLTLTSQPATANRGARILPTGSTLTLNCNGEIQQLDSLNFNDSATLRWNPQLCRQIQLDIQFPGFRLSKTYAGSEGMLHLIRAFSRGELTLSNSAFPVQRGNLAALGIDSVTVRYQVEGTADALELYRQWRQQQQQQQQQQTLQRQRQQLDEQLLDLNAPQIPKGTLSALPLKITSFWNTLGNTP
ncbi:hypothetical protein NCW85_004653 [Salmonella enterica]|nr:hypothetical protein [Salmonella enterica]